MLTPLTVGLRSRTWDDQVRAATWLSKHAGPVVLVNRATYRILALYSRLGHTIAMLNAPRRISCNGDRRPAKDPADIR